MKYIDTINDIEDIQIDGDKVKIILKKKISKSGSRLVKASWKEVPHFDKRGKYISPPDYKRQTISKYDKKFFAQTEECEFLGSSSTLISTEALKRMEYKEPISSNEILHGLMIYEKPKEGESYLISVDPSKDGEDNFAVQVIKITNFPFVQVAAAKLDVDYIIMPEWLDYLGRYYNEAFMIIENNEGAGQSIVDTLYNVYEYENLYKDVDSVTKKNKKYYGFRNTRKTRPLILNMLRIFIEENRLIVNDKNTIDEFYNFIKSDNLNSRYEAEEGYHDDMVMALANVFAPFMNIKAFDDLGLFLKAIKIDSVSESVQTEEFFSSIISDFGFADDSTDEKTRDELFLQANNPFDPDRFDAIDRLND